jgi:hypothetical protein
MALSQMRTTLSVLRKELGHQGKEKQFSEMTGLSISWIKKASCGQIPIPMHSLAAQAVCKATGVSMLWLCDGDANEHVIYENTQAESHKVSLRDYFAGQALAGFAANPSNHKWTAIEIVDDSYALADAMLEQRTKETE